MEFRHGPIRRRTSRTSRPHRTPAPALTQAISRRKRLSRHRHPRLHPLRPGRRKTNPQSLNPRPVLSLREMGTARPDNLRNQLTNARHTVEERRFSAALRAPFIAALAAEVTPTPEHPPY